MRIRRGIYPVAAALALGVMGASGAAAQDLWPDLSSPPRAVGGGEKDAAVIVGAENYVFVPKVPGARQNADAWQAYLTETLNVPFDRVALLEDNSATLEKIRKYAGQKASEVGPGATLWFVFIGHGAPAKDGKGGILVGLDAQQDAEMLFARSLRLSELLGILAKGRQARTVVLLDACFSGRTAEGAPLAKGLQPLLTVVDRPAGTDSRTILLSAAGSDQFAGPLPKSEKMRPAFSYLALGALRGWAADAQGRVTAGGLIEFARKALTLDKGRTQTPELTAGPAAAVLGHGQERGPDLRKIDRHETAGPDFSISAPPTLPRVEAPGALEPAQSAVPDYRHADVEALKQYNEAVRIDKSDALPEVKIATWRRLKKSAPAFAQFADKRAREWDRFTAAQRAADEAERKRIELRGSDWGILSQLLALDESVVPEEKKARWAREFLRAYRRSPGVEPDMEAELAKHAEPGAAPEARAESADPKPDEKAPVKPKDIVAGGPGTPVPSAGDIARWKEDERDCAKCCSDVGGSWRPATYQGDQFGTTAEREDFWGCCNRADYDLAFASCRAASRGVFRDVGRDWFRCERP